jgi:twitching motility protein PilT
MDFLSQLKVYLKSSDGDFTPALSLLVTQSVETLEQLSEYDFVFLRRVLEKVSVKNVDPIVLKQANYKMDLVERRSGKRRVPYREQTQSKDIVALVLEQAAHEGAEVIHLKSWARPMFRIDGRLSECKEEQVFTADQVQRYISSLLSTEQYDQFLKAKNICLSLSLEGISRFKVICYFENGSPGLCFRQVPRKAQSPEEIKLDPSIVQICKESRGGLFLVTGPAVSGKSTTCASLLQEVNQTCERRIITLENPIEYLFSDEKSSMVQREMGSDIGSVDEGFRLTLGDGADFIFLSEIRSKQELEWALTAAENGSFVLSTVLADSCKNALETLATLLNKEDRFAYLDRISRALQAITCQILVPGKREKRVPVREVLILDANSRTLVRENNLQTIQNFLYQMTQGDTFSFHRRFKTLIDSGDLDFSEILEYIPESETYLARYGGL